MGPELRNARCLVIGGAGSVGSHVAELLLEQGASTLILDTLTTGRRALVDQLVQKGAKFIEGSICDIEALRSAIAGADYVFHLAAAWMGACQADPRLAFETNIVGTFNVLEAAVAAGVRKVVFSSAGAVYGEPQSVPIMEDHPLSAVTHYGVSKIAGEKMLEAFHVSHGLQYASLRYFNVYGPRHDHRANKTQIIPRWLAAIESGEPPLIFGDGAQTMDFVYIRDVARANVLAAASSSVGAYNVASGVETSANELANLLVQLTGAKVAPVHQGEDTAAVRRRCASTDRAFRQLGFRAETSLREGLRATVRWRADE
jgi:UDP-glucose 4-epimerase